MTKIGLVTSCSAVLCAIVLAIAAGGVAHATGPGPVHAAALGARAFAFGNPLMEFLRVREVATSVPCPDDRGLAPINMISSRDGFIAPGENLVVAPNVDTLYSMSHLDLADGPVVLTHPDMGDRYFNFQLMDPYTNVVGYIGSRTTGSSAGSFAITWSGATSPEIPGTTTVTVPYRNIWLLGRTLAGNEADRARAFALMSQYELTPPSGPSAPADCTPSAPVEPPELQGIALLNAMNDAMAQNPPPARDEAELADLARIGVGPGLRVADAGLGPVALDALDRSVRASAAALPSVVSGAQYASAIRHDGWASPPSTIGNYGTDYVTRAAVAEIGLGANTPEEAAYSTAFLDRRGRPLDGSRNYRLHFEPGLEPPTDAFFSITVYDGNGLLPTVPGGRHSVSDSRPDLVYRPDGSIDVLFAREDPRDAGANWLPVPDGPFRVYLRMYVPQSTALDGSWSPPGIELLNGGW
ncbi:MAG: DUF1254 domain-containing protein [Rhodococcus sp. (in: high G+C Gram-positive bacteria)]